MSSKMQCEEKERWDGRWADLLYPFFIHIHYFNQITQRKPYYFICFFSGSAIPNDRGEGGVMVLLVVVSCLPFFLILFSSLSLPLGGEDKVCVIMQS